MTHSQLPDHIISYIALHLASKSRASHVANFSKTCPRIHELCKGMFDISCMGKYCEWFDIFGLHHSTNDKPAVINPDGDQFWYWHGKLHRDGVIGPDSHMGPPGPAVICIGDVQKWYQYGKIHRDGGPAIIHAEGTQYWYQHDQLHRDDGPAAIYSYGTQEWYQHDELHRDDGPTVIRANGIQEWWINGIRIK